MSYDTSSEQISLSESEKSQTVVNAITEYLKTRQYHKKRKNRAQTWIFNQFKAYINKKMPNVKTNKITLEDSEDFLASLSVSSSSTLETYRSRIRRFLKYIEVLPEVKVKNRNPESPKLIILELERKLVKKDKEFAKKDEVARLRWQVMEEKDVKIAEQDGIIKAYTENQDLEKEKQCSQCKKLAEKENAARASAQTIDKLRTENKEKDGKFDVERAELESKQGEIASLKTDNEFLKKALEEQSHDKLLEENQYLKVQLGQKNADNERKQNRIREVEQLLEIEKRQKGEFVTRVLRTVRECKEYMPSTNEGFSIAEYKRNSLKSMTNLQDYINGSCQDT
jgi:hypothetical protein